MGSKKKTDIKEITHNEFIALISTKDLVGELRNRVDAITNKQISFIANTKLQELCWWLLHPDNMTK